MIRLGIIGTNYGRTVQLPAFRADPRCEVIALAGSDRTRTAELAHGADVQEKGARIAGIGAPSRASTLVNYVGLDEGLIDHICEIAGSLKIGKCMPGTHIPVADESRLYSDQPDWVIIFFWHITDELAPKLKAKGFRGKLITPLPIPRVL